MFFVGHEAKLIPNLIQKIKTLPKVLRHIFLNVFFGACWPKKTSGNSWQTLLIMPEHAQIFFLWPLHSSLLNIN